MRAYAVVENGKPLQEMDFPTPEPRGTEVLIEVTHCGVCHSDLHVWEGYYDLGRGKSLSLRDRGVKLPLAMGHEIVGRVRKLGPQAHGQGSAEGDLRIVYPWLGCGHCQKCLIGEDNMCQTANSLGIFQNGGYGSHVIAPHPRYLVDPGKLDPAVAATYACSGITVLSAIKKLMPLPPEEPVVVIGAGGLGLNAIAVLKALKHRNIICVDVATDKLAAATKAGATTTVVGGTDAAPRIVEAAGGPVGAVIDLVNASATASTAFEILRKGGTLVQVGLFGGELSLPLPIMAMRSLTVRGSYVGNVQDLRDLVDMAQDGGLESLPVATVPARDANDALMRLRDGKVTGRLVLKSDVN
jgi:propanol-preferring alcohol dehydrogenase